MTFKKLLDIKRQEIMTLKQRYVTGLEKLDFASSQVSVMQQELSDLQPELIKTSAETEKLMVKIEQDTVEVEAKKEVSYIVAGLICFSSLPCVRKQNSLREHQFFSALISRADKTRAEKTGCSRTL